MSVGVIVVYKKGTPANVIDEDINDINSKGTSKCRLVLPETEL